MDSFIKIIEAQQEHQKIILGATSFTSVKSKMQYIRDTCLALNVEVAEFLQELPWKPWRSISGQECNYDKAADEIIDIIIFALNLWITLHHYDKNDCAPRLQHLLHEKQVKNYGRLTNGYNTTL